MTKSKKRVMLAALGILAAAMLIFSVTAVQPGKRALAAIDEINSTAVSTLGELDNNYKNLVMPVSRIISKSVNSTQNGYGVEKMFDNNVSSRWEAAWSGAPEDKVFTFEFMQPETIVGFYEITRNDNNINGTMSGYKIETSDNGNSWQVAVVDGEMPFELGTWNTIFEKPVTAKYIRLTTDAAAISEFRFYYVPSAQADFETLKAETDKLYALVKQGDAFDVYGEEIYSQIKTDMEAAAAMAETSAEETAAKAQAYFNVLVNIKRGINVQISSESNYAEAYAAYEEAKTYYNAAQVGEQPLYWPQNAKEEFGSVIEAADEVFSAEFVQQGVYLDTVSELERGYRVFKRSVIQPEITSDEFVGLTKTEYLMDGLTENRWQIQYNNGGNFDGSKWVTFDYGTEINIDGVSLSCWWSVTQGIKTFKLQYWDGEEWKNMLQPDGSDSEGVFTVENWTNNSNKTEYREIKVKQQSASKFRFTPLTLMSGANNCTIDEFAFSIVVDPNDVSVTITPNEAQVVEGGTVELGTLILPHYLANKNVVWESSDDSVAEVDENGVVTGVSTNGETQKQVTITATTEYGGKKATATVTVLMKQVEDEDKEEVITLYNIEKKYADEQKEADYEAGALKKFKDGLSEIEKEIGNAQSLGQLNDLEKRLETLRGELDGKSLRTVRNVRDLIDRVAGDGYGDKFDIELIPAEESTRYDVWEVDWNPSSGRPVLRGNDAVSLATAFNYYLKYYCYQDFTYVATAVNDIVMPEPLPKVSQKVHNVFRYEYRHYFNVNCEYKYSAVNYQIDEWQHRMDWMAMNGYNMFLFDFDFRTIWLEMAEDGVLGEAFVESSDKYNPDAMNELLMAYMDKVPMFGEYAVSKDTIRHQAELGSEVIQMAFDLDIEPEIRPFYGALPFMFPNNHNDYYRDSKASFQIDLPNSIFDGLNAYLAAKWINSPQGIALSPYTVSGTSEEEQQKAMEVFTYLSDKYYEYYMKVYPFDTNGRTQKYVYKDLVEEQGFVIKHAAYPNKTLSYLEEQFQKLNPKGKWIVSSWTIQQWELDYFSVDKTLVIDLAGNKSGSTNEFWGTQWLWCQLNNYGGNQGVGFDLPYAVSRFASLQTSSRNLSGFALGPEGSDTDPLFYDFMSEFSWRSDLPADETAANKYISDWMVEYAKRRYGLDAYNEAPELFNEMMELLRTTYYSATPKGAPDNSVINAKPKLSNAQARPNADTHQQAWSYKNASELFGLTAALVNTVSRENQTEGFLYDMTDFTRQVLSELAQPIYKQIAPNFNKANVDKAYDYADMICDLIGDMDELLGANRNFLFGIRVEGARSRGATESDQAYYEVVERTFVTYWMADNPTPIWSVYDYANKQLSGYLNDWCRERWIIFRDQIGKASAQANFPTASEFNNSYQKEIDTQCYNLSTKWTYEPYNVYYNAHKDTEDLTTPTFADANATYTDYATEPIGDTVEIITRLYQKYAPVMTEMYQKTNNTDKSALEALYATAEQLEKGDAGDAEWNDFLTAKEYAKQVIDNANAETGEVRVAEIALKNAISALTGGGDLENAKLDLQAKVARYGNIDTSIYTDDSVSALNAALENANAVLKKENAALQEVEAAADELENAYGNLVIDTVKGLAKLQSEYGRLSEIGADGYTYASYKRLTDALKNADAVLKGENPSADDISAALTALKAAEEGLEKVPVVAVDKSDLQTVYDMSSTLTENLYTKESWEALKTAYDEAKTVLDDENATQAQVNMAKDALMDAYGSLEAKISDGKGCNSSFEGGVLAVAALFAGMAVVMLKRKVRR